MVTFITASRSIVWDFDGTITPDGGYSEEIPAPRPEIVALMRVARASGLRNVIASCRWSVHELNTPAEAERNMVAAQAYLEEWDIPYDELRQKPLGEVYVDDKACHANDLPGIERAISKAKLALVMDENPQLDDLFKEMGFKAADDLTTKAIAHFGLTDNLKEAGYVLADGRLLDFSGKNQGGSAGLRALDHREISHVFDGPVDAMDEFMRQTKAIRFDLQDSMLLDFRAKPTRQQLSVLRRAFNDYEISYAVIDSMSGHGEVAPATWPLVMEKMRVLNLVAGKVKDKLPGGRAEGMSDSEFDAEALAEGQKHELEHTNDPAMAREIAKDHLAEDPSYYKKLVKIEASGEEHEWGCLMVDFPDDLAEQAVAWSAANVPDDALYLDPKDPTGYGRETHIHTTVAYGLDPKMDRQKIADVVAGIDKPVKVRLGTISKFEPADYDVIKVEVESQDLHALHEQVKALGVPGETYPDYKPHLTLAYVKKGMGDHLLGLSPFEGQEFELTSFDYSAPPEPGQKDKHTKYEMKAALDPRLAREAIGEALGEASVSAWETVGLGQFQTDKMADILDRTIEKLSRWGAFEAYALDNHGIPFRAHRVFAGTDLVFTDRYQALGIPYPDPKTCCPGHCEGMGVVPIKLDYNDDPVFVQLWEQAEAKEPSEDGWHFVKCPTCGGTGKVVKADLGAFEFKEEYDHGLKFWINPQGTLIPVSEGEGTHGQYLLEMLQEEGVLDQVMAEAGVPEEDVQVFNDDNEASGDMMEAGFSWAEDHDWIRVWNVNDELAIEADTEAKVTKALNAIAKQDSSLLFVKTLVAWGTLIPVDEGEDAQTAWQRRNSVRKRVAAGLRVVGESFNSVGYHGTRVGDKLFDEVGVAGDDYYVASAEDDAEWYATEWKTNGVPAVIRGQLSLKNVIIIDIGSLEVFFGGDGQDWHDFMREVLGLGPENDLIPEVVLPYQKLITDYADQKGFDGVVFTPGFSELATGDDVAVFDPTSFKEEQVKLQVPETGEWTDFMSFDEAQALLSAGFPNEVAAVKAENKFDQLYKAAVAVAQDDAKYSGALENPALAQEQGQFQQAVKDARTEAELQQAWTRFGPSVAWEALQTMVGAPEEAKEPVAA